jgi:cytoskeletal protein CcmA (bactofilin family)
MNPFRRRIGDPKASASTYVAHGSKFSGTLTGKGAFVFCGEFEGDCDIEGPVTLAAGGRWTGTLKATDIIVAGSVNGDVIATQRVEILGSARIAGSLSGHSIAVAEGAVIDGELRVTSGEQAQRFDEKRKLVTAQAADAA